jgi:hypothetical protein
MPDPFAGPKSLLRHAEDHVSNLSAKINAFMDEKPWAVVIEKDLDGTTNLYKVKFTDDLAWNTPNVFFDAVINLRAVLDQTAYATALLNKVADPKSAKFPFGPTEDDMLRNAKGGCKDLPPEITKLFIGFKPYRGGNNPLWTLNELANTPKHKIMVPVFLQAPRVKMNRMSGSGTFGFGAPRWDREKNEFVFASAPDGVEVSYDDDFAITVTLDHVDEIIRGQHPIRVLNGCGSWAKTVLGETEELCRKLGVI